MKKPLLVMLAILLSCAALFAGCDKTPEPSGGTEQTEDTNKPAEPEMIGGMEVVSPEEMNTFGSDALRLFGRTYLLQEALYLDNAGTGYEVTFYGTHLEAEMRPTTDYLYYRVFIDGDATGTKKHFNGKRSYVLAKDLEEGVHTVRVVKSTSSQNGAVRVSKFQTDGKFLRPEKKDRLRMEFVGDSITVGAGLYGKAGVACAVDNSDAAKCYAYLTAQALDADFSIVATEGICVKKQFVLPFAMTEMYEQYSSLTTGKYPYPEETHDVVVIALGTNDGSYMGRDKTYTQELFAADYAELLDLVRSKNPHAKIVCVYGMMYLNAAIENGIKAAIAQKNDPAITFLQLPTDNAGADSHPSLDGAKKQSEALTEYLNGIL